MHLTQDEIKDKIFEIEMEQKELTTILISGTEDQHYIEMFEENKCWFAYYKDLLKELEQGE